MRVLVWIVEDTWEATVAEAAALAPAGAQITLLHVAATEVEAIAGGARRGLLGRRPPPPPPPHAHADPLRALSEEAAQELLAEARRHLGRDAEVVARRGRVEREVVAAAEHADLLVLARDGDRSRLGPRSLGPATRFVVDHAPCPLLLVWPEPAPDLADIPPPPPHPHPHPPHRR
jgi:nucleotide-binding universal stress UspA family protein